MKPFPIIGAVAVFVAFSVSGQNSMSETNNGTSETNNMPASQYNTMERSINHYTQHLEAGLMVGEPTGGTLKYWLNNTMAVDGAVGWSWHDHTDIYFQGDILWHNFNLIPVSHGRLPVYIGAGGLVRFRNHHEDNDAGIRVPVGISYLFDNAPVEVFAEIGPALDVAPDVHGEVTGGVGVRYRF